MIKAVDNYISSPLGSSSNGSSNAKREALYRKFRPKISVNPALDRALVSLQANKNGSFTNWFKYREGFSESLLVYLLQYLNMQPGILRWDVRSGRSQGKKIFKKGYIYPFREAINEKLNQIAFDLEVHPVQQPLFGESFASAVQARRPELYEGSCLEILPTMEASSLAVVLTSPPYAESLRLYAHLCS